MCKPSPYINCNNLAHFSPEGTCVQKPAVTVMSGVPACRLRLLVALTTLAHTLEEGPYHSCLLRICARFFHWEKQLKGQRNYFVSQLKGTQSSNLQELVHIQGGATLHSNPLPPARPHLLKAPQFVRTSLSSIH